MTMRRCLERKDRVKGKIRSPGGGHGYVAVNCEKFLYLALSRQTN